tara:strand:+ start:154686 stop:155354 length:669 start_codon:yes stop_codon:yes gene_type:complete
MSHPLDIKYSIPLEREYESWIAEGIEKYFENIGIKVDIWAVSPSVEKKWPSDEQMIVNGKLIGLQVKRAHYSHTVSDPKKFGKLHWLFSNPKGQYDLVKCFPEIYYCLPTFLNRGIKKEALSHCLFWRPEGGVDNSRAWYDNPLAGKPFNKICNAPRWGKFLEGIYDCTVGKRVRSVTEISDYVSRGQSFLREFGYEEISAENDRYKPGNFTTYYAYVPFSS